MRRLFIISLLCLSAALAMAESVNGSIAVVDFQANGVPANVAATVTETFNVEIFKTGRFKVIERSQMTRVLSEQKFQLSGMTDSEFAQFGKMLGADYILVGSVSVLGSKYIINARVVEVKTASIIKAENGSAYSLEELDGLTRDLARRMAGMLGTREIKDAVRTDIEVKPVIIDPGYPTVKPETPREPSRLVLIDTIMAGPGDQYINMAALSYTWGYKTGFYQGLELGWQTERHFSPTNGVFFNSGLLNYKMGYALPLGILELSAEAGAGIHAGVLGINYSTKTGTLLGASAFARAGAGLKLGSVNLGIHGTLYGQMAGAFGAFYPVGALMAGFYFGLDY